MTETTTCDHCDRPYRPRGQATDTTCSPCMNGRPRKLIDPTRTYRGLVLKASRYALLAGTPADMIDDGHVDEVAVLRVVTGHRGSARITPRELVCVVYEATRRRMTDRQIADLLGTSQGVVHGLRTRSDIEGVPAPLSDEHVCRLIAMPSLRVKASRASLVQAGVIAA